MFTNETRQSALRGFRQGLPIMIGYLPLGFAYGVLAVKNDISALWAVTTSIFVFAGAGQFIAAGMIGAGAPLFSIIVANMMVNLRHILMSAALVHPWRSLPVFWRNILSLFQTDEIFAVSVASAKAGDEPQVSQILSCALVAQSGWIVGTAIGAISGDFVADVRPYGLDFALPCMFIALLVPLFIDRISITIALFSALCSLSCMMLGMGRWSIILATVLGASLGLYLSMRKNKCS